MAHLEEVWKMINDQRSRKLEEDVRREIFIAVCGVCLFHTYLGARLDNEMTCSDASMTGGAMAVGHTLSEVGESFLNSRELAYRCLDVVGAQVAGARGVDIHRPANRVVSRRWPSFELWEDVRSLHQF